MDDQETLLGHLHDWNVLPSPLVTQDPMHGIEVVEMDNGTATTRTAEEEVTPQPLMEAWTEGTVTRLDIPSAESATATTAVIGWYDVQVMTGNTSSTSPLRRSRRSSAHRAMQKMDSLAHLDDFTEEVMVEQEQDLEDAVPPRAALKRGRGRPRKYPPAVLESDEGSGEIAVPKRGRGRPKKCPQH
jgi:hypothetical protein